MVYVKPIVKLRGKPQLPKREIDLAEKCIKIVSLFTRGAECIYCFRSMHDRLPGVHTQSDRTGDHYVPRSRGGRKVVDCCRRCNGLKKDMTPVEWMRFMTKNRGYFGPRPAKQTRALDAVPRSDRIAKPKLTYDQTRAFLQLSSLRASPNYVAVPKDQYEDPVAQLAFELAMQNPRHRHVLKQATAF